MRAASGLDAETAAAAPVAGAGGDVRSDHLAAWHSPVPYLFGGLAAMLGLIALALLILACSYWKLSGFLESGNRGGADGEEDAAGAEPHLKPAVAGAPCGAYEEKIVVIMAGDEKPTFLATPASCRASSFGPDRGGGKEAEQPPEKANGTQVKSRQSHENQHVQV